MAGTFNLTLSALRWGDDIHAIVQANLPAGHRAEIVDIYPGGGIIYRDDPGEAQIFIRITRAGDAVAGAGKWEGSRAIPHSRFHHDLAVIADYEGRTFVARTKIHRFKPARTTPAAAADPVAIRRTIGLPPAACIVMTAPADQRTPIASTPVRLSNSPASAAL